MIKLKRRYLYAITLATLLFLIVFYFRSLWAIPVASDEIKAKIKAKTENKYFNNAAGVGLCYPKNVKSFYIYTDNNAAWFSNEFANFNIGVLMSFAENAPDEGC